jgi:hypothetical protein
MFGRTDAQEALSVILIHAVMPGRSTPSRMRDGHPVVPGIHVLATNKDVDGRDKPGHDDFSSRVDQELL